ncbi:MAG: carbohydrate ABC transporter permease [Oscillospiraceae bacterium]|nr:carbohydrate ABC transporter permease [Oscillospiraceae bacterium]
MVGKSKSFQVIINIIMVMLSLACILPFALLIIASFTDEATLLLNGYSFFPAKLSLEAYEYIWMSGKKILKAYGMTFFVTAFGTFFNIFLTLFLGYLLSKRDLPGRSALSFFVFFTMLFNGGMVPSYIVWSQIIGVRDTVWGLILPNLLMGAYNVILMRTYFTTNLPQEIIEAAQLDACSEIGILFRVAIPLSKPMIATIGLFSGLAYWNDWTNGLYYLVKRTDLYTIQNVLNNMMNNINFLKNNASSVADQAIAFPSTGLRVAIAVVAVLPVLAIYPFFQKFFVKGIVVGGVKG